MQKLIIIKYGELTTKKDNINFFIKTLNDNVKKTLSSFTVSIIYDKGRMYIEAGEEDFDRIINKLKKVFGIHEIMIGYKYEDRDINSIGNNVVNLLKNSSFNTFKVITKRSDKTYELDSMEISRKIGGCILKNIDDVKVDVHNPEEEIYIELRKDAVYIYFERIKGIGGYPVSSLGKGMLMLSGGIDSPVAGFLAMKRGVKIEGVYFESPPHTSEQAKNKVIELSKKLAEYNMSMKLHVINFTNIQEAIYKNIPHEYLITIMRRMMYRITTILAKRSNAHAIINGESVGQVASQTLSSMYVINNVTSMPVIRPVACMDKLEIIDISNKIGTYETSILPFEDCCTIFLPRHPVINPNLDKCIKYENSFDYESLIDETINNIEVVSNLKGEDFSSIL